jgi:hypothetical protein
LSKHVWTKFPRRDVFVLALGKKGGKTLFPDFMS